MTSGLSEGTVEAQVGVHCRPSCVVGQRSTDRRPRGPWSTPGPRQPTVDGYSSRAWRAGCRGRDGASSVRAVQSNAQRLVLSLCSGRDSGLVVCRSVCCRPLSSLDAWCVTAALLLLLLRLCDGFVSYSSSHTRRPCCLSDAIDVLFVALRNAAVTY